ncbi:MAG: hypothetical protein ACLQQB_01000 [Solirubrobacteraceae bacterium]
MSSHTSTCGAATPKQLKYLRDLALQAGATFTSPQTWREASCQIDQLKALKASRGTHLEIPRNDLDPAEEPYATEQKPGEIKGYGSSARRGDPAPQSMAPAPRRVEGEPVQLGRYETKAGEQRALYGIRIKGKPRIIDAAAEGAGRIYTVEKDLREKGGNGEVKALVADYIAQAEQLGQIPMASSPTH